MSQGTLSFIGSSGAVRVCLVLQSCLEAGTVCKNRDKQMTYIVRVRFAYHYSIQDLSPCPQCLFICSEDRNLSW